MKNKGLNKKKAISNFHKNEKEAPILFLILTITLVLGAFLAVFAGYQKKQYEINFSTQKNALFYFVSKTSKFVDLISSLNKSKDVSGLTELNETKNEIKDTLTILQQGGYLQDVDLVIQSDGTQNKNKFKASQLTFNLLDKEYEAFSLAASGLKQQTEAYQTFNNNADLFSKEIRKLNNSNLPQEFKSPIYTLAREFTANGSVIPIQAFLGINNLINRQSLKNIQTKRDELRRIFTFISQNSSVSFNDKEIVKNLFSYANSMVEALEAKAAVENDTSIALGNLLKVEEVAKTLENHAKNSLTQLLSEENKNSEWNFLLFVGLLISLISLLAIIKIHFDLNDNAQTIFFEQYKNLKSSDYYEKLGMKLQKMLMNEVRVSKLSTDNSSLNFRLISSINQFIEQRQSAANILEESGTDIQRIIHETEALINQILLTQDEANKKVGSGILNAGHFSGVLYSNSEKVEKLKALMQNIIEVVSKLSGTTQSASWKLDSIRESVQDASKRIKRLGEASQSVLSSSDSVKDISSRVKVLALNIAVESASYGDDGKIFMDIAKELEALSKELDSTSSEINYQSNHIQDDSRKTVEVMEDGISEVVSCAKLSGEGIIQAKNLLNKIKELDNKQEEISKELNQVSEGIMKEQATLTQSFEDLKTQTEKLQILKEKVIEPKSIVQAFKQWLTFAGRTI